jgi:hypothetical protein
MKKNCGESIVVGVCANGRRDAGFSGKFQFHRHRCWHRQSTCASVSSGQAACEVRSSKSAMRESR